MSAGIAQMIGKASLVIIIVVAVLASGFAGAVSEYYGSGLHSSSIVTKTVTLTSSNTVVQFITSVSTYS